MADGEGLGLFGTSIAEQWGAGLFVGADQTYVTPRSDEAASNSAMDSMRPIQAPSTDDAYGWLKDLTKTAVGYVISKDAQQNKVVPPQQYSATAAQAQGQVREAQDQARSGNLLVLLLLIGGAVLVLKD